MAEGLSPVGTKSYAEMRLETNMVRTVSWWHVFFIAAGVPALVLFSMGGIAAITGPVAPLAWTISMIIGFIDCFIYAEIAGLHPRKSGRHRRPRRHRLDPLQPVHRAAVALVQLGGVEPGAGHRLRPRRRLPALDLLRAGRHHQHVADHPLPHRFARCDGLDVRINAVFIIGALILLAVWNIQHYGILRTARIQMLLTMGTLIPLLVVTIVPIFQGSVVMEQLLAVRAHRELRAAAVRLEPPRLAVLLRGAVHRRLVHLRLRDRRLLHERVQEPRARTCPRPSSGPACSASSCFILVPFVFQGVLGTEAMLAPDIYSGAGIGAALAGMMNAGEVVTKILVVLLVFTLLLAIMTAMSGSSRTIFQGGQDGWLPKYLAHLNDHHVPTYAMWTDLDVQPRPPADVGLRVHPGGVQRATT